MIQINATPSAILVGCPPEFDCRYFVRCWTLRVEPFFTTKPGGTGLGLTGVAITSRLLNGSLHVRSNEPHGTEVSIYLPVVTRNT